MAKLFSFYFHSSFLKQFSFEYCKYCFQTGISLATSNNEIINSRLTGSNIIEPVWTSAQHCELILIINIRECELIFNRCVTISLQQMHMHSCFSYRFVLFLASWWFCNLKFSRVCVLVVSFVAFDWFRFDNSLNERVNYGVRFCWLKCLFWK